MWKKSQNIPKYAKNYVDEFNFMWKKIGNMSNSHKMPKWLTKKSVKSDFFLVKIKCVCVEIFQIRFFRKSKRKCKVKEK